MSNKIRVMIVEDQAMPRQLFEAFIKQSEKYELAVSVDNAAVADIYCLRYSVSLILMDVVTKNSASGLDAAENIKRLHPNIKIIIVTSMPECSYIDRAKAIGVEGFWYKEISAEPILTLMDRVSNGEIVYPDSSPQITIGLAKSSEFTDRELEVLREMTGGYNNNEIAERLYMSVSAVKRHIESMLSKTRLKNRIELAVRARESGLVILDRKDDDN